MNSLIILSVLVAVALAGPVQYQGQDKEAQVLRFDNYNIGTDGFKYEVESSNGIKQQEEGVLQNVGQDNEALVVRGSYSYVGDDGVVYQVDYVADAEGFHPVGVHLPKAQV